MVKKNSQSGFIMMIMLVILVVGAGVYFSTFTEHKLFQHQSQEEKRAFADLNKIKDNLLLYAVLHPEFYATNGAGVYRRAGEVPGPGYFPCPDNDGRDAGDVPDGRMAGSCRDPATDGFVHGFLAPSIKLRNVFFTPTGQAKQYYFVMLEQLAYQNLDYLNRRFTPLNSTFSPPNLLSLNGRQNYVALIFAPGKAQSFPGMTQDQSLHGVENFLDYRLDSAGNRIDGNVQLAGGLNTEFFSKAIRNKGINDLVVGITLGEWQRAIKQRVDNQRNLFCTNYITMGTGATAVTVITPINPHWFNEYHATNNPLGGSWRGIVCP